MNASHASHARSSEEVDMRLLRFRCGTERCWRDGVRVPGPVALSKHVNCASKLAPLPLAGGVAASCAARRQTPAGTLNTRSGYAARVVCCDLRRSFFPSFLTRTLPEERSNGTISVSSL